MTRDGVNFRVLPYQYNVRGVYTAVSIVTVTLNLTYQIDGQDFIRSTTLPTLLRKIESHVHDVKCALASYW